MRCERRRLLLGLSTLVADGCASSPAPDRSCAVHGAGPGLPYCLVGALKLRFPGASALEVGQVELRALDDNSAAILARDERGFFALSATCPHACCTVSLCASVDCGTSLVSPNDCAAPRRTTVAASGPAYLCPCHGSEFAADGSVLLGPAIAGLPQVAVELAGADALADLSQSVPAGTRIG